ncbi:MAG: Ig-like domain-containing protein [Chitinophagaceae bacterium]|nr:Ig-like domain-containing protein [Chitinophagaceae bacterium]
MKKYLLLLMCTCVFAACNKSNTPDPAPPPSAFHINSFKINEQTTGSNSFTNVAFNPVIKVSFSAPVDHASVNGGVTFQSPVAGVPYNVSYANNDSTIVLQPTTALLALTKYTLVFSGTLQSSQKINLSPAFAATIITGIDSTDKFPQLTDNQLLDLVQKQTFTYFWDFGHPVSGMARERNTSGDVVTTGGTGFSVMGIIAAMNRNFITRGQGLARINTIVNFLKNNCTRYHGAFPHWINGTTGITIPFSTKDDGADLVETSYLMQGLLCARQYFSTADPVETSLRTNINILWNGIEWNWFRQGGQNILYWHWSPNYNFQINAQIRGWDEALIVYALAASSNTDSIPRIVYDNGWAGNGSEKNGGTYFGIQLPLGPSNGGPLFFAHYSFLGINPHNLTDQYADYFAQNVAHSLINYNYCKANPAGYFGYSYLCWGLTASDDDLHGYAAHEPNNDDGVISPTAAISSLPYTPTESMNALRFFYFKLGDKIWKQYGFVDAFCLSRLWYADSFLAIDQGPQIVMIENYRSSLLWNLFMSCPEIKRGMKHIGFQSPNL